MQFYVFHNPSGFSYIYALMMFNNSLRVIKTDRETCRSYEKLCVKYYFNVSAFVGFIVRNVVKARTLIK